MKIIEGKSFEVGKEYKVFYYAGCNKKECNHTAKCISISGTEPNRKGVFQVGERTMNYLVDRDMNMSEINGIQRPVYQDTAVHALAKKNPTTVSYMHWGVIYAQDEISKN